MKRLILFLPMIAWGQAVVFSPICPLTAPTAGVPFTVGVSMAGQPLAASQFSLALPTQASSVSVVAGAAATAATKTLTYGNNVALIWGMNQTLMQAGTWATVTLTIATAGQYTIGLSNTVGADGQANPITTTQNPPCAVSVLPSVNKCDLSGNGSVGQEDATLIDSWIHGSPAVPLTQCDKNADGKCNIVDLQVIVYAGTGGPCTAVQ